MKIRNPNHTQMVGCPGSDNDAPIPKDALYQNYGRKGKAFLPIPMFLVYTGNLLRYDVFGLRSQNPPGDCQNKHKSRSSLFKNSGTFIYSGPRGHNIIYHND